MTKYRTHSKIRLLLVLVLKGGVNMVGRIEAKKQNIISENEISEIEATGFIQKKFPNFLDHKRIKREGRENGFDMGQMVFAESSLKTEILIKFPSGKPLRWPAPAVIRKDIAIFSRVEGSFWYGACDEQTQAEVFLVWKNKGGQMNCEKLFDSVKIKGSNYLGSWPVLQLEDKKIEIDILYVKNPKENFDASKKIIIKSYSDLGLE